MKPEDALDVVSVILAVVYGQSIEDLVTVDLNGVLLQALGVGALVDLVPTAWERNDRL